MVIKPLNVLALYCLPSFESIECACIKTDGVDIFEVITTREYPLPPFLRVKLDLIDGKKITNPDDKVLIDMVEDDTTNTIIDILQNIISTLSEKPDLIGLEGPTIFHDAAQKYTYQLGKGQKIFEALHIPVMSHFHNADILNGGLGHPLLATYYHALASSMPKPALFIDIGFVTTFFSIGTLGEMLSFDATVGLKMLGDFMKKHAGISTDYAGKCTACGRADNKIVQNLMRHPFFDLLPPKHMPHDLFKDKQEHLEGLSVEDGAATIVLFMVESITKAVNTLLPLPFAQIVICGEGTKNPTLVRLLKQALKQHAATAEVCDYPQKNDAAGIAFLAARCYYHLPITFPETTGVVAPMTGGKLYHEV